MFFEIVINLIPVHHLGSSTEIKSSSVDSNKFTSLSSRPGPDQQVIPAPSGLPDRLASAMKFAEICNSYAAQLGFRAEAKVRWKSSQIASGVNMALEHSRTKWRFLAGRIKTYIYI
jgi:hypothetical protein